jgi:hypothetical protein
MLVAIQLPDHLVVAGSPDVEIRDSSEIARAGFDAAYVVAPPGNLRAGVDGCAKDGESVLSNLLRERGCFRSEGCTVKGFGDWGRIRKRNARLEVRIKLDFRGACELICVS